MGCGSSKTSSVDEHAHLPPKGSQVYLNSNENGVKKQQTSREDVNQRDTNEDKQRENGEGKPATEAAYHSPPPPYSERDKSSPTQETVGVETADQLQKFFIEFPTPHLLWEANKKYGQLKSPLPQSADGAIFPYPVSKAKAELFDEKKFKNVDKFAIEIDQMKYKDSLEVFTSFLTKQYLKDELAKVRVMFRWLAAQDINKFGLLTGMTDDTVLWHLQRLKENPGFYSETFLSMCRYAGFQCRLVSGYAKHATLEPGQDPTSEDVKSWIIVLVNGSWRLVDPHWGSSHMVGNDPGEWLLIDDNGQGARNVERAPEETAYACNEVYFLTDPQQFVYSHIPMDDENAQLLARSVTLREFTEMAYLKPAFFELDLRLLEHRKCVLYASEGEIDFQIGTPPGKRRTFMYRLWMSNTQSMDNIQLDRFCIMQQKNNTLFCRIYFPKSGKFKLELFGRDSDEKSEGNYCRQICAFIIHCDKPAEGVKAFPENNRREWGPGPDLEASGLKALSHDDAIIEAEDGTVVVRFKADRAVEILHHLHSNTKSKEDLKGQIVHYMDDANGELVVYIRLPDAGDYALNLFSKDEKTEGTYPNVCSYIVSTENIASDSRPYPAVANGRIGSLIDNRDLNLKLISHDSPLIMCPESGEVELEFTASKVCETMSSLELYSKDGNVKKEDFCFGTHDNKNIKFKIRFPEPGIYALNVFAKDADKEGTYTHVYTCILTAPVPMHNCTPFPAVFAQWKPGCTVQEPTSSVIQANSKVLFSARIPHAHNVAIIDSNDEWSNLAKDEDGYWKGEVDVGGPGQVKVSAVVKEGSDSYTTLLTYKAENETDLKEVGKKQQQVQERAKKQNEAKKMEEEKEAERRKKDFEKAKQDLVNALKSRDLAELRKAVKAVERKKYVGRLQNEVQEAKTLIKSLERIHRLKQAILKMDQKTMLEMRNYQKPPKGVHEVMLATLLLLGDSEKLTKEWSDCQKCLVTIGKDGLHRRITSFDVTSLHPEIAARALQIIGKFRLDDVRDSSAGAGTFYAWSAGMIEEVRLSNPEAKNAIPANMNRQKDIFGSKNHKHVTNG